MFMESGMQQHGSTTCISCNDWVYNRNCQHSCLVFLLLIEIEGIVIMGKQLDKLSKFISLVLRHNPDAANIVLDEHGWANVDQLLKGINQTGLLPNIWNVFIPQYIRKKS